MGKKESVPNRQYTEEFKVEAVRLAESIGGNATAKRLGVPQSTVTNWVKTRKTSPLVTAPIGQGPASLARRPVAELEAENARLRRELANTKLDLEVVKNRLCGFAAAPMNRNRRFIHSKGIPDRGRLLFGGTRPRQKTWPRGSCGPSCGGTSRDPV
jgi:transposase